MPTSPPDQQLEQLESELHATNLDRDLLLAPVTSDSTEDTLLDNTFTGLERDTSFHRGRGTHPVSLTAGLKPGNVNALPLRSFAATRDQLYRYPPHQPPKANRHLQLRQLVDADPTTLQRQLPTFAPQSTLKLFDITTKTQDTEYTKRLAEQYPSLCRETFQAGSITAALPAWRAAFPDQHYVLNQVAGAGFVVKADRFHQLRGQVIRLPNHPLPRDPRADQFIGDEINDGLANRSITDITDRVLLPGTDRLRPGQTDANCILPLLVIEQPTKLRLCWDARRLNQEIGEHHTAYSPTH